MTQFELMHSSMQSHLGALCHQPCSTVRTSCMQSSRCALAIPNSAWVTCKECEWGTRQQSATVMPVSRKHKQLSERYLESYLGLPSRWRRALLLARARSFSTKPAASATRTAKSSSRTCIRSDEKERTTKMYVVRHHHERIILTSCLN